MSSQVVNSYRFKEPSPYIDGIGATGDGIVTWNTNRAPLREAVQLASNLPAYSWHFATVGEDNYPTITTGFTENMGNKFSFSGWVKPTKAVSGMTWNPILGGKGLYDGDEEFNSYWVGYAPPQEGSFGGDSLGCKSLRTSGTAPATNSNNHVVYTVDGDAGEYYCWVNGTQHSTATGTESANTETQPLTVGTNHTSVAYDRWFYGNMQQYLYYNRVLTDAEVGLLYGSGNGIALPATSTTLQDGLRIYFDFQEENVGASGDMTIHNVAIP